MAPPVVGFNQVEISLYGESGYPPATDLPTVIAGIVATGATWIRIGAFWSIMEAVEGTIEWAGLDAALVAATNAGLNILVCATVQPSWTPTPTAYGDFVGAIATRYGPGTTVLSKPLRHYELWNEPNILFSGPPGLTIADMYAYHDAGQMAIKAVDSGSFVITAGMIPVPNGFGSTDAVTFLTGMYALVPEGQSAPWDGVGFHDYSGTSNDGAQEPTATQVWIAEIPQLYAVMVANGDTGKPIWLTEFGFETQPSGQAAGVYVTPATQAQWLVEQINTVINLCAAQGIPLGPQLIYNYRDSLGDDSGNDGMGVVLYNFAPRPSWSAIQALLSGGAAVGVTSGSVVINIGVQTTATGAGPAGITVGGAADVISEESTATGTSVGGPMQALWAGVACQLNPIAAPMSSVQQLIDDVVGIPGATVDDFIAFLNGAAQTAAGAAQAAASAGGDLVTMFVNVVGDFEADVNDFISSVTGTATTGIATANSVTALWTHINAPGAAGINYDFSSSVALTADYGTTSNPAWSAAGPLALPTVPAGQDYVWCEISSGPQGAVFTGNPQSSTHGDHGMITDRNQVFATVAYLPFGQAVLFLSGNYVSGTLNQNVYLLLGYGGASALQLWTATGAYSGTTLQTLDLASGGTDIQYDIPSPGIQAGDVIGLQFDITVGTYGTYTIYRNNVGVASWPCTSIINHGAGNRECGVILFNDGFNHPQIGWSNFTALDFT